VSRERSDTTGVAAGKSPLDKLPQNQQDALEAWLFEEKLDYKKCIERLRLDFDVKTTDSSVSRFYKRVKGRRILDGIEESVAMAKAVEEKYQQENGSFYKPLLERVGQTAFDKSVSGEDDPETIYNYTKLLISAQKEKSRREQIALQRERFQFDAAKACLKKLPELKEVAASNGLNQDEKIKAVREILFGAAPAEPEKEAA
jgi:hypothetical protein